MNLSHFRVGNGYIGSSQLETTTSTDFEILPEKPDNWTHGYSFYKFSFMNNQSCTVKINNSSEIFLRANQGFVCDYYDKPISSFVILEDGIEYNWIGAW